MKYFTKSMWRGFKQVGPEAEQTTDWLEFQLLRITTTHQVKTFLAASAMIKMITLVVLSSFVQPASHHYESAILIF